MAWNTLPIVDFTACSIDLSDHDVQSADLTEVTDSVVKAFENVGFLYIKNHGIPRNLIEQMFKQNTDFFNLPLEHKRKYLRGTDLDHHGYCPLESEQTCPTRPGDYKECYDMDPHHQQEHRWPEESAVPGFKATFTEFYKKCEELWLRILMLVGRGLKLQDVNYFVDRHDPNEKSNTVMRVIKYPDVQSQSELKENQIWCGEHSDYGSLTFLFQDDHGGLQVWNKSTGTYVDATPIPDTLVVNLGDLMQRWTADRLLSTKHRVVNKKKGERHSIIVFVFPSTGCLVECIDGSNKYPPITADQHLRERYADTF